MSFLTKAIYAALVAPALVFLAGSFIAMEINPANWPTIGRIAVVLSVAPLAPLVIGAIMEEGV